MLKCKNEHDAKKIAFGIANSPLVKTAIAGEDPNWGRIMMAAGKNDVEININFVNLIIGGNKVLEKGQLSKSYSEQQLKDYMKNDYYNFFRINLGKRFHLLHYGSYKKIFRNQFGLQNLNI